MFVGAGPCLAWGEASGELDFWGAASARLTVFQRRLGGAELLGWPALLGCSSSLDGLATSARSSIGRPRKECRENGGSQSASQLVI